MEQATGSAFSEVFASGILRPLGIEDAASFQLPPRSRLSAGHMRKWTWQTPVLYLLTPSRYWASAAGSWSRFERLVPHGMAYGGLYASPAAFAAMGARYVGKHGGGAGFHGNVRLYPDLKIATVFFANATRVTAKPIDALSDRLDAPFIFQASRR